MATSASKTQAKTSTETPALPEGTGEHDAALAAVSPDSTVKLYHRDGREREVGSPAAVVKLEFDGWARDKSVFKS